MQKAQKTKKNIAEALKTLCARQPFDKISIADITEMCGLNRQSFYYHFEDKYELLSWIYYEECFSQMVVGISFENWNDRFLQMLTIMKDNQKFYVNTIKRAEDVFVDYLYDINHTLFFEAASLLDQHRKLTEEDKTFFAQFFSFGICGVVISWAKSGMKTSPKVVAGHLQEMVNVAGAWRSYTPDAVDIADINKQLASRNKNTGDRLNRSHHFPWEK